MSINKEVIIKIIKDSIMNKLNAYKPESVNMPFHHRLLGKDKMALFSFIHSLNSTFGTSIFEPVAEVLAIVNFIDSKRQFEVGSFISSYAQNEIQRIINDLAVNGNPSKLNEIERIRKVCNEGNIIKVKVVKADLFIKDNNGKIFLFDLKTAKPNISNFKDFKRTLLEWVAIYLYKDPNAEISTYIAIPYNPYEPMPYERWTIKGMIDDKNELLVGKEFWDFLGGDGAYEQLLDCFEQAGIELRGEIDNFFEKFRNINKL